MAQLPLTVTVPDQYVDTLIAALAWKYPNKFTDPANPTNAEARDAANDLVVDTLRQVYKEYIIHQTNTGAPGYDGGISE